MLLCDIGNTTYHFCRGEETYKEDAALFRPESVGETVYYICVNAAVQLRLERLPNWRDLRPLIDWSRYYDTMGIDRVAACEAVTEGVVIDAGSAITVDRVRGGVFEGGFIYPGLSALASLYGAISPRLAYSFNFGVQLDTMPKNSRDAVSYGVLAPLVREIDRLGSPRFLTGGDAGKLAPLFPDAILDERLLFRGMTKIIQKAESC